jgi:hypothetical protein
MIERGVDMFIIVICEQVVSRKFSEYVLENGNDPIDTDLWREVALFAGVDCAVPPPPNARPAKDSNFPPIDGSRTP